MLHTAIFIGRSGCGKGTQADLLKNYIAKGDDKARRILYLETGDSFRKFIRGESYSSKVSNAVYESDERQPDFLACWMWVNMLIEELEEDMHIVFDGAPRSLSEAHMISTAMTFYKREKPVVIHIDVSRKWSEDKLLTRGRIDDLSLPKINKRLDWFERDTMPAIEYFKKNPMYKYIEIDGEQAIDRVHSDIIAAYDDKS